MAVYAIAQPGATIVKIGQTGNVRNRFHQLRMSCPVPLEVRAHWPGDAPEERVLHAAFTSRRSHGEWFEFGDDDPVTLVTGLLGVAPLDDRVITKPAWCRQLVPAGTVTVPHERPRDGWVARFTTGVGPTARECHIGRHPSGRRRTTWGEYLEPVEEVYVYERIRSSPGRVRPVATRLIDELLATGKIERV